jgi:Ig-like domain CHU_C associated
MKKLKLIGLFIGLLLFGRNGFTQSPINYAEYYWDTDPGYGLGISLGAINTTNLDLTTNVSTTGLLAGSHYLNVRVRDANGIWSQMLRKPIIVAPETYNPGTDPQDIRVFEYKWDAQTPLQATVSGIVNFEFIRTIPTTSLGEGSHILSIRMKDAYGFWTSPYQFNVTVYGTAPGDNISRIEYFIGTMSTDPGYGLATSASFTPASSPDVTATFEPSTTGLTNGENLITFRVKDSQNRWSSLYQKIFNLDPSFTLTASGTFNQGNQAKSEFCLGGKIKVPITKTGVFPVGNQYVLELSDNIGANFVPIVTTINGTQDTLIGTLPIALSAATGYRIRAVTTLPLIRKTSATILTIGNTATATATPASVCQSSSLALNSSGFVASNYSWTGPPTFTSAVQNPLITNMPTNGGGIYAVTATSLAAGCTATATTSVTVKPLPTVTPSSPISICSNVPLTLGVNATASGTYLWNGPSAFTSALQNPTVSNTATTAMTGTYTITVTLNACTANGTASVTVNPVVNAPTANGVTINQYTSTTLSAICTGSTAKWYSASSGGTAIGTGSYTTPTLLTNATYYVACETGGTPNCVSSTRTAQIVTIIPATTFDTATSGNWNATSTWFCSCIPNGTLPVRIMSNHIVTVPTAYTGQAKGLRFISTGKVTLQGTGKVNVIN